LILELCLACESTSC